MSFTGEVVFDQGIGVEKMGPGAAATFDPELGKKIEGIEPRATQDYLGKHVAELMNSINTEQLNQLFQDIVHKKQAEVPEKLQQRFIALHNAIDDWQGGSTKIAHHAQYIITGGREGAETGYNNSALHIINGIMNAPERRGTLFRGMRSKYSMEKFDNLKSGDVMRIDRPSSFTTSHQVSKGFTLMPFEKNAKGYRIIVADRYKGLDAKANIIYSDEQEVITYGRFRVIKNTLDQSGIRNIIVRQLEVHGPSESVKLSDPDPTRTEIASKKIQGYQEFLKSYVPTEAEKEAYPEKYGVK